VRLRNRAVHRSVRDLGTLAGWLIGSYWAHCRCTATANESPNVTDGIQTRAHTAAVMDAR